MHGFSPHDPVWGDRMKDRIELKFVLTNIEDVQKEADRLVETLKEAKSLMNDLASAKLTIDFSKLSQNLKQAIHDTAQVDEKS